MGTVLSFSPPRDRKMVYNDLSVQNISYEQLNNAKNKEKLCFINNNNNIMNNENNLNRNEKNTLKKHSLFINALSWKRFTSGSTKKKQENNNKNKLTGGRQPLDSIHPFVDNNKNIQKSLLCYSDPSRLRIGQLDLVSNRNNVNVYNINNNNNNNNNVVLLAKQLPPLSQSTEAGPLLLPRGAPQPPPPPPRQSSRSAPPTTAMKPVAPPTTGKKTVIQASTSELLR